MFLRCFEEHPLCSDVVLAVRPLGDLCLSDSVSVSRSVVDCLAVSVEPVSVLRSVVGCLAVSVEPVSVLHSVVDCLAVSAVAARLPCKYSEW